MKAALATTPRTRRRLVARLANVFFFPPLSLSLHAETKHNTIAVMTHLLNRAHFVVLWQKECEHIVVVYSPPPVPKWMVWSCWCSYILIIASKTMRTNSRCVLRCTCETFSGFLLHLIDWNHRIREGICITFKKKNAKAPASFRFASRQAYSGWKGK